MTYIINGFLDMESIRQTTALYGESCVSSIAGSPILSFSARAGSTSAVA